MQTVEAIKDHNDASAIYNMLIKWNKPREAELFQFGCNVALRITDLLNIKFTDIKMKRDASQYITLNEQKTGKQRDIYLNKTALECVTRLKAANPDHVYLFQATARNVKGIKPIHRSHMSKVLTDVQEALGLDFNLGTHSMRKTFGYHAYNNGCDINVLQELFNHSSVRTTFKYIGINSDAISSAYRHFELSF